MKKLTGRIGIDQGDVILFSDFDREGPMWSGEGQRQARSFVHFSDIFEEPPSVRVWITMWDISNGANARADVMAEDISEKGFAILFRTWGDTRVARVRVGWQAIGPVRDDEVWDVE